jgi:hypothetical protein
MLSAAASDPAPFEIRSIPGMPGTNGASVTNRCSAGNRLRTRCTLEVEPGTG